ncbi:MAG: hypothetical protein IT242_02000 [Bacteroidia bacterium]|nr:hypothetical protein [Bacteroidia bacterium]
MAERFIKKALLLTTGICILILQKGNGQCCAGGSGCSITGEASTGVLQKRQIELSTNFQFISTDKFYKRDRVAPDGERTFDSYNSSYQYFRLGYGISENFTLSVEGGYYFLKKETGLDNNPSTTYSSKGIGDLILFPRYDILNHTRGNIHHEITVGMGYKVPLGSYNDSTGNIEPFSGQTYYVSKPTSVQLSSGAQDIIFYAFLFRGNTVKNLNFFANAYYIKKGWNPNGEKLGDYASVAIFAGKSFFKRLGITMQLRYEWVDTMKINESVLLFGKPSNYFPEATGYKKIFLTPQISYTFGKFTFFAASDFPIYQFLNSSDYYTQVGSRHQTTVGLTFRLFAVKGVKQDSGTTTLYSCPMHPEVTSSRPGQCPTCGMDLELKK